MLDNIGHAIRTLIFKAKPPIFRRQKAQGSATFVYKIKQMFLTLFGIVRINEVHHSNLEIKLHQERWFKK